MNSIQIRESLDSGSPLVIYLAKQSSKLFFTLVLFLGLVFSSQAQSNPEVIKGWDNLEEAEFLVDVYYQIVKCSADSDTQIHLWAFNEGGKVDAVGFDLVITDEDGTELNLSVEKFDIGFGKSHKADCASDQYSYLKFDLSDELDISTMSIDITYNK